MTKIPYPVFVRRGDAREEVDEIVAALGLTAADAGLHKYLFVAQAHQTVVMVSDAGCPLAETLRTRKTWNEGPKE